MDQNDISHLFGAYDIRGIVGENLDSEITRKIARAYGKTLCPNRSGRFLIGHDGRISSAALVESFSVGLREAGHQVVNLGLASTPMIYWCGAKRQFDGSICVTASHLPPEHNGFKLCREDAIPLSGEQGLPEIIAEIENPKTSKQPPMVESIETINWLSHYVSHLQSFLNPVRPLKIAVDAGNGVGGIGIEELMQPYSNLTVWKMGMHPDGMFPERSANPLEPQALDRLSQMVIEKGCDFGLAFDGDADRAVAVDEKGTMIPPDFLGGIIALHLLKTNPKATILYDLRATRAFPEAIFKAGGTPIRCRVGHAFVKVAMRQNKALFAAELSGHYYYADLHYTDSGIRTLIELINLVSASNRPLSYLIKPFQIYATSGEINKHVDQISAVLNALEKKYSDGKIDHLDGLSVDYPDWWFNVRASQTEPLIRINVGATTPELLDEKQKILLDQIEQTNVVAKH